MLQHGRNPRPGWSQLPSRPWRGGGIFCSVKIKRRSPSKPSARISCASLPCLQRAWTAPNSRRCSSSRARPRRRGKSQLPTASNESSRSTRTRSNTHIRGGRVFTPWHTQLVFGDVWLPQVWNRRPGRERALSNYR